MRQIFYLIIYFFIIYLIKSYDQRVINDYRQPASNEFQRSKSIIDIEKIIDDLPAHIDLDKLEKPKVFDSFFHILIK